MPSLLDAPEIRDALASGRDAARVAKFISRDWEVWCHDLDTRMGIAIVWISHWRQAATYADAQRKTGKLDLWAFGDAFIPEVEAFRRDLQEINAKLEVSEAACPLQNRETYVAARESMEKVFEYFSRWPRTNHEREKQAVRDQAAGNFVPFIEIPDDLCR